MHPDDELQKAESHVGLRPQGIGCRGPGWHQHLYPTISGSVASSRGIEVLTASPGPVRIAIAEE